MVKLSQKWSRYLSEMPETGAGYHLVRATFKDGTVIDSVPVYGGEEMDLFLPYSTDLVDLRVYQPKMAIRMRIKPPKRRTPVERLKARLYYRRNRSKIRLQRRRYLRKHKSTIKHRKEFLRYKPTWFKKPKKKAPPKPKKFKVFVPKKPARKKPS